MSTRCIFFTDCNILSKSDSSAGILSSVGARPARVADLSRSSRVIVSEFVSLVKNVSLIDHSGLLNSY